MRPNQREWGTNSVFPQVYTLYTSCKERGSWARLVLETDSNGEETVTFSVKETSHSIPAPSQSYQPPPARRGGRKTPSKARKDKVKWRAWLERKLEESREEVPSLSKPVFSADPPAPSPSYASVCISSTAETTAQATCTLPSAAELVSHNAEENIYSSALLTISSVPEEKDADNATVTTPTGTKLARMQPMDTDSEVIIPPALSIQQLDGEAESGGEETRSPTARSPTERSPTSTTIYCVRHAALRILFSRKKVSALSVTTAVMPGFQEEKFSSFARVDTINITSNVKAVE